MSAGRCHLPGRLQPASAVARASRGHNAIGSPRGPDSSAERLPPRRSPLLRCRPPSSRCRSNGSIGRRTIRRWPPEPRPPRDSARATTRRSGPATRPTPSSDWDNDVRTARQSGRLPRQVIPRTALHRTYFRICQRGPTRPSRQVMLRRAKLGLLILLLAGRSDPHRRQLGLLILLLRGSFRPASSPR